MTVDQRNIEPADDREAREPAVEPSLEEVVSGRSPATPFVVLGSVAAVVWAVVALVSLAILLVWWLARKGGESMYIGAGTLLVILLIVLLIWLL